MRFNWTFVVFKYLLFILNCKSSKSIVALNKNKKNDYFVNAIWPRHKRLWSFSTLVICVHLHPISSERCSAYAPVRRGPSSWTAYTARKRRHPQIVYIPKGAPSNVWDSVPYVWIYVCTKYTLYSAICKICFDIYDLCPLRVCEIVNLRDHMLMVSVGWCAHER